MVPKLSASAIPRPSPAGNGLVQSAMAATRSSAARKRGWSVRRSRRKRIRILARGVCHLVDERLLEESVLGVQHRPPRAQPDRVRRIVILGALVGDGVGHVHRLAVAAPGVVRRDRQGRAARVQSPGEPRHAGRAIVVVLDVVFAAPDKLHRRRRHCLGDARAEVDVVVGVRQTAPEAAAEREVGERDLLDVHAKRLGRGRPGVERILHTRPDLGALARRHAPCTPSAPSSRGPGMARGSRRSRPWRLPAGTSGSGAKRLVECGEYRLARDVAMTGIVERRLERGERLARVPVACRPPRRPPRRAGRRVSRPAWPRPSPRPLRRACRRRPARFRWRHAAGRAS